MIRKKKVTVKTTMPIFDVIPGRPIVGQIASVEFTTDQIRKCLVKRANVREILGNGQYKVLNLSNYDKFDDEPVLEAPVQEPVEEEIEVVTPIEPVNEAPIEPIVEEIKEEPVVETIEESVVVEEEKIEEPTTEVETTVEEEVTEEVKESVEGFETEVVEEPKEETTTEEMTEAVVDGEPVNNKPYNNYNKKKKNKR